MKYNNVIAALLLFCAAGAQAKDDFGVPETGNKIERRARPGEDTTEYKRSLMLLEYSAKTLCKDQDKLINRVDNIQTTLRTASYALGVLSVLEKDLRALEVSVETLYTAALAAEAIPQSREKAKPIRESLATARTNVKKARASMTAITLKTEPVRLKLVSAADKAGKVETALTAVNTVPCGTTGVLRLIEKCAGAMPADKQACAYRSLGAYASMTEKAFNDYDALVRPLITDPADWLPALDFVNPFTADMQALDQLRRDIEALTSRLDVLAGQLSTFTNVLNREFGFSFPYPNPKWDDPFRTSNCDVKVSARVIIQGADAIQRAIEDYIGGFLWGVLKGIGVDKYVRQLQDAANGAINEAMKLVHFDMDVSLPSLDLLDTFEADELVLENALDALKIPEPDLKAPGLGLPGFPVDLTPAKLDEYLRYLTPYGLHAAEVSNFCASVGDRCK